MLLFDKLLGNRTGSALAVLSSPVQFWRSAVLSRSPTGSSLGLRGEVWRRRLPPSPYSSVHFFHSLFSALMPNFALLPTNPTPGRSQKNISCLVLSPILFLELMLKRMSRLIFNLIPRVSLSRLPEAKQ